MLHSFATLQLISIQLTFFKLSQHIYTMETIPFKDFINRTEATIWLRGSDACHQSLRKLMVANCNRQITPSTGSRGLYALRISLRHYLGKNTPSLEELQDIQASQEYRSIAQTLLQYNNNVEGINLYREQTNMSVNAIYAFLVRLGQIRRCAFKLFVCQPDMSMKGSAHYYSVLQHYGDTTGSEVIYDIWLYSDTANDDGFTDLNYWFGVAPDEAEQRSRHGLKQYARVADAPPANTEIPDIARQEATFDELLSYFPNHCLAWPGLALVSTLASYTHTSNVISIARDSRKRSEKDQIVPKAKVRYALRLASIKHLKMNNIPNYDDENLKKHLKTHLWDIPSEISDDLQPPWSLRSIGQGILNHPAGHFANRVQASLQGSHSLPYQLGCEGQTQGIIDIAIANRRNRDSLRDILEEVWDRPKPGIDDQNCPTLVFNDNGEPLNMTRQQFIQNHHHCLKREALLWVLEEINAAQVAREVRKVHPDFVKDEIKYAGMLRKRKEKALKIKGFESTAETSSSTMVTGKRKESSFSHENKKKKQQQRHQPNDDTFLVSAQGNTTNEEGPGLQMIPAVPTPAAHNRKDEYMLPVICPSDTYDPGKKYYMPSLIQPFQMPLKSLEYKKPLTLDRIPQGWLAHSFGPTTKALNSNPGTMGLGPKLPNRALSSAATTVTAFTPQDSLFSEPSSSKQNQQTSVQIDWSQSNLARPAPSQLVSCQPISNRPISNQPVPSTYNPEDTNELKPGQAVDISTLHKDIANRTKIVKLPDTVRPGAVLYDTPLLEDYEGKSITEELEETFVNET